MMVIHSATTFFIIFSSFSSTPISLSESILTLHFMYALMALNFVYESHIKDYKLYMYMLVCSSLILFFSAFCCFTCIFHPLTLGCDCFHAESSKAYRDELSLHMDLDSCVKRVQQTCTHTQIHKSTYLPFPENRNGNRELNSKCWEMGMDKKNSPRSNLKL